MPSINQFQSLLWFCDNVLPRAYRATHNNIYVVARWAAQILVNRKGVLAMSKPRHLRIRGVRKDPPDIKKLSRAIILLAQAQAEADAAAQDAASNGRSGGDLPQAERPPGAA